METARRALGVAPAPAAGTTDPSSADAFRRRIAEIEKTGGKPLSDEEKNQLQLDFFLRMLALGQRRGSTLLGSIGEGGLATSALGRQMQDRNRAEAAGRRREAREDAFREIGFMDKDADNRRADRREAAEEKRWGAQEERDRERLRLMAQQIAQGKWKVLDSGKSGTYVLFDQETGQTKDTGIKVARAERDTRPAEIQLLEHLRRNPQDLEPLLRLRGREKENDDSLSVFKAANERLSRDSMVSPEDAVRDALRTMRLARGEGIAEAKPDPITNKGRTISGPDGRWKSDGKQWVKIPQADAHREAQEAIRRGAPKEAVNQRLKAWGYEAIK